MLFLDGVYVEQSHGSARFRWVKAPTSPELTQLTHTIAHRVGRYLERQGLLERDVENSYLASDAVDDDPMTPLLGHSITYRIAVGSQAGRKVFTLQTLPTSGDPFGDGIGKVAGSSLHAGVAARADERKKLERLCRYISRPAVSEKRLSLTRGGNVRYQLKTPYRDGTTHVIFEPLDFIARLAALVPKPRVNLTRFHGVFAPNSRHRALVTPAKRGRGNKVRVADEPATPAQRRASMTWAQRLKRVFNIDIETCSGCGGAMKVIACIEDPIVIKQILDHLKHKAVTSGLKAVYQAPTEEAALMALDKFAGVWDEKYPQISKSWRTHWENLNTFFGYPPDIRKAIYTTNAIESLNSVIRQAIKKRKVFPTDDSVRKVIYLAIQSASKKWSMPIQNWRLAMSRFIIEFGDRFSEHL